MNWIVWEHSKFPEKKEEQNSKIDIESLKTFISQYEDQKTQEKSEKEKSYDWIVEYGKELGLSYWELIDAASHYINYGEYLSHGPRFEGEYLPDEFWVHYENATGNKVEDEDKGSFFSCSC